MIYQRQNRRVTAISIVEEEKRVINWYKGFGLLFSLVNTINR